MRWLIPAAVLAHLVVVPVFASVPLLVMTDVYTATTSSMEPTIPCSRYGEDPTCRGESGALVVESPLPYWIGDVRRGDIVSFDPPAAARAVCEPFGPYVAFVKRVVALEGDATPGRPRDRVPAGHVYVLGDNRELSCDSRHFGPVPRDDVYGKVVAIW